MNGFALDLYNWWIQYGYWIIFLLIMFEGPITTVVAGWFASLGFINLGWLIIIVVIADLSGDLLYYFVGRFGRQQNVVSWTKWLGFNYDHLLAMEKHFSNHAARTFAIGKITHGVGGLVLLAAGMARVPLNKFLKLNLLPTILKSAFLVFLGYYFGRAYNMFANFFDYLALFFLVSTIILYLKFIHKNIKKLL